MQFIVSCGAKRKEGSDAELGHLRIALMTPPGRPQPPVPPRPSNSIFPMVGLTLDQSTLAYNLLRQWLLEVRGGGEGRGLLSGILL